MLGVKSLDYNQLRNVLAVMKRGDIITLPHPTEKLEISFSERGIFSLNVSTKVSTEAHAVYGGTTSLKEMIHRIQYYYEPRQGYVYQHINGNVYHVVAIANQESKRPEYPPTVVYQGLINGKVWAKPLTNFMTKMTRIK